MSRANAPYCPLNPLIGYNECTSVPGVFGILGLPAAANVPPGGSDFSTWTDNKGNLWLQGGTASGISGQNSCFYQGIINALWVFRPGTNQWAWMGGDFAASNCSILIFEPLPFKVCDGSQGSRGKLQDPGIQNIPPTRLNAAGWVHTDGIFWLFSGAVTSLSYFPGYTNDLWKYQPSITALPAATQPIFSLKPGTYTSGGPLLISNGMSGAKIYYTTDGSTPTFASSLYSGPINLSTTETVKAIAVAPGYRDSAVSSANYLYPSAPAPPTF
jgi:hypothetical protein